MNTLLSLDLVKGAEATSHLAPGVVAYLLCVYGVMLMYLRRLRRKRLHRAKKMTIRDSY